MRLLIDEQSVPGVIIDQCKQIAQLFDIETETIRKREEDLYKLTSRDFDIELRNLTSYNSIQEFIQNMESNDILITDDTELAKHALPRIATIIGSNGLVFTQHRIEMLTIQDHLNRMRGKVQARKILKERDNSLDDQFRQTLYEYLVNVVNQNG